MIYFYLLAFKSKRNIYDWWFVMSLDKTRRICGMWDVSCLIWLLNIDTYIVIEITGYDGKIWESSC